MMEHQKAVPEAHEKKGSSTEQTALDTVSLDHKGNGINMAVDRGGKKDKVNPVD